MSVFQRMGPLGAAVAMLIGAGLQLRIAATSSDPRSNTGFAVVLVGAGLITLGVWIAIEVWHHRDTADAERRSAQNHPEEGA